MAANAEKRLALMTAKTAKITRRGVFAGLGGGLRSVGGRVRGTATGLTGGGLGIAGLAAGFGVFEGLKKIVEVTREAQVEQARLRTQVTASGISWKQYGGQIMEVLKRQQEISGFTRFGPLKDTFTLLLRTTGNVNDALKLNALATNIARGGNISLGTAGKLVARVYSGNFGILKRYGIILGATVKTPLQALVALQAKFAGQAAAFGNTWQGKLDKAKNSIRELAIAFGSGFLPAITKAISGLNAFASDKKSEEHVRRLGQLVGRDLGRAFKATVGWVRENWPAIQRVFHATVTVVRAFIGVLRTLKGMFGTTTVVVGLLALKFLGLRNMIGLVRGSVRLLLAAIRLIGPRTVASIAEAEVAVGGLRKALLGLRALGPIAIPIAVAGFGKWFAQSKYGKAIDKSVSQGLRDVGLGDAAAKQYKTMAELQAAAKKPGVEGELARKILAQITSPASKKQQQTGTVEGGMTQRVRDRSTRSRAAVTGPAAAGYGDLSGVNPPETDAQRRAATAAAKKAAREAVAHTKAVARARAEALRKEATEIQLTFKRAISKARLTTGLGDDIAAAQRQVSSFKHLLSLHKQDVHIQRDLVNAQTQLNSLRQKEKDLLANAVSNAQAAFGEFGSGTSDVMRKQQLGVPGVDPERLLAQEKARLAFFLKGQAALATLARRGAPAGLITQLRGQGEEGEVIAESLAKAKPSTLKGIFATFKAGQKAITRAAHIAIASPHVTLNAGQVSFGQVAAVGHGGSVTIENLHLPGVHNAQQLLNELQRIAKRGSGQTRGRHGGQGYLGLH